MSAHTCGCGRTFRKGARIHVLLRSGEIERRIVCEECERRAVRLVPPKPDDAPCSHCTGPAKKRATVCGACVNLAVHRAVKGALEPFARHLRKLGAAYKATNNPLCLGLAQAADVLDAARAAGAGDVLADVLAVDVGDSRGAEQAAASFLNATADRFDVDPRVVLAGGKAKNGGAVGAGVMRLTGRPAPLEAAQAADRAGLSLCSWRMLLVLARRDPNPTSAEQLGILSGYPSSKYGKGASTYRSGIGALASRGFVTGSRKRYHVTPAGLAAAGELPPAPTGAELLAQARAQVKAAASTMLELFVSNRGRELTRGELEDLSGYTGSTFRSGIGRLRTLELVKGWRLAPELVEALDADEARS